MGGCEQPKVARINETGMHKCDEKSIDKMEKNPCGDTGF